jgi:hypothetical protein
LPEPLPTDRPSTVADEVLARVRRLGRRGAREQIGMVGARSAVAALAVAVACRMFGLSFFEALPFVGAVALAPMLFAGWRLSRTWTPDRIARDIERAHPHFDNLLVTAAELAGEARPRTVLADEVCRAALGRLAAFDETSVRDGRYALPLVVFLLVAALGVLAAPRGTMPAASVSGGEPVSGVDVGRIDALRVQVTPPEYIGLAPSTLAAPDHLEVPYGSTVELLVVSAAARVEALEPDGPVRRFEGGPALRSVTVTVTSSSVWTIRAITDEGEVVDERLLPMAVIEDRAPTVRVVSPGGDQMFPDARRRVAISVEAVDDHGLGRLVLRYTRVTGSGETFTFVEGEMPVTLDRRSPKEWRGSADLDLEALGLELGDTLVYRAAARDRRPGALDAVSDSFLIEIGGVAGAASGGFTLPEDEHRHAISQQMVIIKTESLHAARGRMTPEEVLEESHHLSAEQRMVRAEFVFMTGGHVHDEVEEAEASNELAEGRFENEAMIEMIAASSHMSRAERHLIDGDTAQALVAERLALTALQRAFDRRRYFLRTTPERSRIDLDRRLSGPLDEARGWVREGVETQETATGLAEVEQVLVLVHQALASPETPLTDVARAVAALEPGSADVQRVVVLLSRAAGPAERSEALASVTAFLRERAAQWLAPAAEPAQEADPARGRLRQALRPGAER